MAPKADCKDEKIARHVEELLQENVLVVSVSRDGKVVEFAVSTPSDYGRVIQNSRFEGLPLNWIPERSR
jgi:hypothetical protein